MCVRIRDDEGNEVRHDKHTTYPTIAAAFITSLHVDLGVKSGYKSRMIQRYSRPIMTHIWEDENRFRIWLEIEIAICEAYAKLGVINENDLNTIKTKAHIDVQKILEIEKRTKHDVVAFIEGISEPIGPSAKYIHMGVTSSDILDTCFAYQLGQASDILIEDIQALMAVLKERALQHKNTPAIGRTHGIHAEPVTFGLKITHFYDEMRRNLDRMRTAAQRVRHGKISGAVGTYAHVPPFVEEYVCEKMGLTPAPISSQIVPRDYHAEFFTTVAIVGSSIERMAMEVRSLQRTEVGEAEEFFQKGQTGSSAMPHKRNPIASENLCGLARLLHGYAMSSLENIPLWHERDISHSSVERVIGPDATILLDYMLERVKNLYANLIVYPERMQKNLEISRGLYHSEAILLALIKKGLTRLEAYKLTQGVAMRCFEQQLDFVTELKKDKALGEYLSNEEIENTCTNEHYFQHVDTIFKRIYE